MTTLLDTSCLLRLRHPADTRHVPTREAVRKLRSRSEALVMARQNAIEFRGVASRPTAANGLGLSAADAEAELDVLERLFPRLPERAQSRIYATWRSLCQTAGVSGKQVHDTRLVAVCVVEGVSSILTWNPSDFLRFVPFVPALAVWTPDDVLAL